MSRDERCESCPLSAIAHIFADALSAKLCPKDPPKNAARLISPADAAKRLNKSRSWLDRRRHALPFVKERDGGRGYDVIEHVLEQFISARR